MSKQDKMKSARRSVSMGDPEPDPFVPAWQRPEPDECEEWPLITLPPNGADPRNHRILVRMTRVAATDELVEFATIQQTFSQGKWRDVATADSCHDVDVHLHRCGKRAGGRVGDPEHLMAVECLADVERGYQMAFDAIATKWSENLTRWQYA